MESYFPILIMVCDSGKQILCRTVEDVPFGVKFIVLKTRCDE